MSPSLNPRPCPGNQPSSAPSSWKSLWISLLHICWLFKSLLCDSATLCTMFSSRSSDPAPSTSCSRASQRRPQLSRPQTALPTTEPHGPSPRVLCMVAAPHSATAAGTPWCSASSPGPHSLSHFWGHLFLQAPGVPPTLQLGSSQPSYLCFVGLILWSGC